MHGPQVMLTTAELAGRPDFRLGRALVSPSMRTVSGPGGTADVEPRVMQVLVVLADSAGQVVTRDTLFSRCWGGTYVGDDSLNRAVGVVRRLAQDIADASFEIETIPRTGYRLTGQDIGPVDQPQTSADGPATSQPLSRRMLVTGGAAAALGAAGLWWTTGQRTDPRFDALIERGEEALRLDEPTAAQYFERAAAIEPGSAKAHGLLAYALLSGRGDPSTVPGRTAQGGERAARTALEIDPNEPNALLAMTFIQSDMLDRYTRELRYRHILAIDPENTRVMRGLGHLLHGAGRCRDSLAVVERALRIDPLTPDHRVRKAMRLWVFGRVAEADREIDHAMGLWPSHRLVPMARLMIYAFTARTGAALAMVEEEENRALFLLPEAASVWRSSLAALETGAPSDVAAARAANLAGARRDPAIAAYAILILSALGELDAAFEVANGFLLSRGSVIVHPRRQAKASQVKNAGWRNTFGLFTPPTKAMRLDRRFGPLADGLGLSDYWRRRGIGPDAFLFRA